MNPPRVLAVAAGCLILALACCPGAAWAQQSPPAAAGLVHDWSSHHVAYTGLTEQNVAAAAQRDPRVWMSWLKHSPGALRSTPLSAGTASNSRGGKKRVHVDWSASLGGATASLPAGAMAAKFSFSLTATPSCTGDFVAYGLNVAGSGGQANIIAFNNLYSSGVVAGGGLCDAANSGQPTVLFAFNAASATVAGSLSLSLDGHKLAFAGNTAGAATFYVLTWGAGGGTATAPLTPDVTCATSCLRSVALGAATDTSSSPYIDYSTGSAYVGDDVGRLWKINSVFSGTPTLATSDPNWPATGFFQTGTAGHLLSPVAALGKIYVTDAAGNLHTITPGSTPTEVMTTLDATGTAGGQGFDGPIVSVNNTGGTIFAFGQDHLSTPIVLQTSSSGGVLQRVSMLGDGTAPTYDGTFDNTYFTDPTTGFLYVCATNSNSQGNTVPVGAIIYRIAFSGSTTMATTVDTGANASLAVSKQTSAPCSPLTEIFNPNILAHPDSLFVQLGDNCDGLGNGCVKSCNISSAAITSANGVTETSVAATSGAITVDNISTAAQASSIYFAVPGSAVKLTQSTLQ